MTDPYYVVASRKNSILNNSTTNSSWEYKLNTGLVLPKGSQVQITNSFINKKGIASASIDFREDSTTTLQVGYYIPQAPMLCQKPERSPRDDRLTTSTFDDRPGALGLQTPEISIPDTNFYDCLVHHNVVHSDGLDLFNVPSTILSVAVSGDNIQVTVSGDLTSTLKENMPCRIENVINRDGSGTKSANNVQAPFCRFYGSVISSTLVGSNSEIIIEGNAAKINGDYSTCEGQLLFPDILSQKFKTVAGVAYINSLVGTKENGDTYYSQSRLNKPLANYEGAETVPPLDGQPADMQYQGGIRSDFASDEFRKHSADIEVDSVWNAKQTAVTSYDFDRCSYSFYFGNVYHGYDEVNNQLNITPAYKIGNYDFEENKHGFLGSGIRMNCNNITIGLAQPRANWLSSSPDGLTVVQSSFFPFQNTVNMTEYPDRKDLSVPKPGQPAKFKDSYCTQTDYLINGFSYDKAPMRVEIFSLGGMPMHQTDSTTQNPFQPNIYQLKAGQQTLAPINISTVTKTKFLDRVLLSQSMISGLMPREDSFSYVKRDISISQDIGDNYKQIMRVGMVLIGIIEEDFQTDVVKSNLFPHREFRGELDSSDITTGFTYRSEIIKVPFMITEMTNEGTTNAFIVTVQALSNLVLVGAKTQNLQIYENITPIVNTLNSNVESFSDYQPFNLETFNDSFQFTIMSEEWTDQNPQYIPLYSAKGCFSDLNGDSPLESNARDNDVEYQPGLNCRLNYFVDSMHSQAEININEIIGENFALNPNYSSSLEGFTGLNKYRIGSHPYLNHVATTSGGRPDFSVNKRIICHQRGNDPYGGIHPRRDLLNPGSVNGLENFKENLDQIPICNYLFSTTKNCSLGGLSPPEGTSFDNGGQVVISQPVVAGVVSPENNGIDDFFEIATYFDIDSTTNSLKLKVVEEKAPNTAMFGIFPLGEGVPIVPVPQNNPLGRKTVEHNPACASALGDMECHLYDTPEVDLLDCGGTNSPLCLVQLQALVENYAENFNDYILCPLTSEIPITIFAGTYSIQGFLDIFNGQIKDLNKNDPKELTSLDTNKSIKRFLPLGGLSLGGGQVSLLSDFLEDTHNRTIYSEDPDSEYVSNPLVIAVTTQVYNDLCRAWQSSSTAQGVSGWLYCGQNIYNAHTTTVGASLGGSYIWSQFRDSFYWAEFVDKYPDTLEDLIEATDPGVQDVENFDIQFYFAKNKFLDDTAASPYAYGTVTCMGIGENGVYPSSKYGASMDSGNRIDGQVQTNIDKIRKYNSTKKGIYVGAPDLQLAFDQDLGIFSLSRLHWENRTPTVDLIGESAFPSSAIDEPSILFRDISQLITGSLIDGTDHSPEQFMIDNLQTPQDSICGCFVYNMDKEISQTKGNFINASSCNIGRTYNDYFETVENAKLAWKDTLWYQLGFDYEVFNVRTNNKLAQYYFEQEELGTIENTENPFLVQTAYFLSTYADQIKTVKVPINGRQGLCSIIGDIKTYFSKISLEVDDNYLPGTTTSSSFDIRSLPDIGSLPGVEEGTAPDQTLVRLYNNGSISTCRSMSGGYVFYPYKLGTPNTFNGVINYTCQNISLPGEGFVYHCIQPPACYITQKSGAPIPDVDQLIYNRPMIFNTAPVPGYVPSTYYDTLFTQSVSGTDFPVGYQMTNFSQGDFSPLLRPTTSAFNITNGVFRDRDFSLLGSMLLASQTTPILSNADDILASNLPTLSDGGFFIITSDILSSSDSVNQSDILPVMATVPVAGFYGQDMLVSFQGNQHITSQDKILNSIIVKIYNSDMTEPMLEPDSTVIFQIVFPPPIEDFVSPLPKKNSGYTNQDQEERIVAGVVK